MGIVAEYNPDLALRNFAEFQNGRRKKEECLPEKLVAGKTHAFLKRGQRQYWLQGEIPLVETTGNQQLSLPLASIIILEVTHFLLDGEVYTKGVYEVVEVFPNDSVARFNGFTRL